MAGQVRRGASLRLGTPTASPKGAFPADSIAWGYRPQGKYPYADSIDLDYLQHLELESGV